MGVAARSSWWMDNREHDHLLVVLADGTGTWDTAANDWAIGRDRGAGTAAERVRRSHRRWIDATWTRDTTHLDRRDGRVLNLLAEIAAPVQGTTKDAVVGEELRQRRRTVRTAIGAAALLLVLTIAGGDRCVRRRWINATRPRAGVNESLSQGLAAQATDEGADAVPTSASSSRSKRGATPRPAKPSRPSSTAAKQEGQLPRVISPRQARRSRSRTSRSTRRSSCSAPTVRSSVGTRATSRAGPATGLRDSRFQIAPATRSARVRRCRRGGTVYELDDSLRRGHR